MAARAVVTLLSRLWQVILAFGWFPGVRANYTPDFAGYAVYIKQPAGNVSCSSAPGWGRVVG